MRNLNPKKRRNYAKCVGVNRSVIGSVSMHKIEFIPSFLTNFWLFSSKGAENSENRYLAFLTIIKESNVFI